MEVYYIYNADTYCDECGARLVDELENEFPELSDSDDSETWPQEVLVDQEETDCPIHCGECRCLIPVPLTGEGRDYVARSIAEFCLDGSGDADVIEEWIEAYDIGIDALLEVGRIQRDKALLDEASQAAARYIFALSWADAIDKINAYLQRHGKEKLVNLSGENVFDHAPFERMKETDGTIFGWFSFFQVAKSIVRDARRFDEVRHWDDSAQNMQWAKVRCRSMYDRMLSVGYSDATEYGEAIIRESVGGNGEFDVKMIIPRWETPILDLDKVITWQGESRESLGIPDDADLYSDE